MQLDTKNESGQLTASVTIPLASYGDEPITVALADANSPLIVRATLGALPPAGKPPFKKWVYKTKLECGVVQVQLQKRSGSQAGLFKLGVKTKRRFNVTATKKTP